MKHKPNERITNIYEGTSQLGKGNAMRFRFWLWISKWKWIHKLATNIELEAEYRAYRIFMKGFEEE